jgi:voltage-gated potassium channel
MIGGVALIGIVTATLASWLIEQISETEEEQASELRAEIAALGDKLDQLLAASDGQARTIRASHHRRHLQRVTTNSTRKRL